jgi:GTPase Era involved in 16S rRNA processing
MNRTEFVAHKNIQIEQTPFVFIDTPGQTRHKARRMQAIREQMTQKSLGIINVVAYGYHEAKSVVPAGHVTAHGVDEAFLTKQRKLELEQLDDWATLLDDRFTSKWILTIVCKADLWWDKRKEALEYYESGEYQQKLSSLSSLPHHVVENCSYRKKFFDLAPMSGHFDDNDNVRLKADLLQTLLSVAAQR